MGIRHRLAKLMALSLTAGALAVGGIGWATTTSADTGQQDTRVQMPRDGTPLSGPARPASGFGGLAQSATGQPSFVKTDLMSVAARRIGITVDALRREMGQGRSLVQVAAEHGVARADLKTTLIDAEDADLQKATADGSVSQTQANQLVSNIPNSVERLLAGGPRRAGPGSAFQGQPGSRPNAGNQDQPGTGHR